METDHERAAWPFYAPPGHAVRKVQGVALIFYAVALVLYRTDHALLGSCFTGLGLVLFLSAAIWAYRHRHRIRQTRSSEEHFRR